MKKVIVIFGVFSSAVLFGQKSEEFVKINYNSICCGTPSVDPVINYIENFKKSNNTKKVEVYKQPGLGREGEFRLYVGASCLPKAKKSKFWNGLESTINAQNKSRTTGSDGMVELLLSEPVKKESLKEINNLILYKKEK